jgi:soluble lytic murein transglycosylase
LAQGSMVFAWDTAKAARVATLIRLGLRKEAANWVGSLTPLPGVHSAQASLGRGRILYALGDYTLAMRHVAQALPEHDTGPWAPDHIEALMLAYPLAYATEVTGAAQSHHISDLLLLSIMRQESAFSTTATSTVSAQGLMQIMPSTGRRIAQRLQQNDYRDALLTQPATNVGFGAWYLKALIDKFSGNLAVAIGAYNAGPMATQRWLGTHVGGPTDVFIEDVPYKETRNYIKKVLGNLAVYTALYQKDAITLAPLIDGKIGDQVDF